MSLPSRSLRVAAALLAAIGLLARPARAVVVCPMETGVAAAVAAQPDAADEHAHHASDAAALSEDGASDAEHPAEAPAHEICPDLAHCAVAAPARANDLDQATTRVRAERLVTAHDRPTSPVSSVEPPPPKRN